LKIRPKTIQLFEKNTEVTWHHLGSGRLFTHKTKQKQTKEKKYTNGSASQLQHICASKGTVRKVGENTKWKHIFANPISDKKHVSKTLFFKKKPLRTQ